VILNEVAASEQIGFPILSILILLPVVWAILLNLIENDDLARKTALVGAFLELCLSLVMVANFTPGVADIQFAERVEWMAAIGVGYHVGVDGISVMFVPLTALLTLMVMLSSYNSVRFRARAYLTTLFALQAATIGIFVSLDLFLFFVFWELILIPSYVMLRLWGIGPQREYAALKYVMYMLAGSAPLLMGIVLLGINHFDATGTFSFDLISLLTVSIAPEMQTLVFFLLAFGFAVKGPLFPFHTWLPTALMEGPMGMSVLLVGLKLGIYGFLRFAIPLTPEAAKEWAWLMLALGVTAILYGALIALVQLNLRRLVAFGSVGHVGLAIVGLFALNVQGLQGTLMLTLNLGIATTGLLFLTGFLHSRTGSSDLSALGGLARHVPLLTTSFFILGLAFIGVPGTSGFPGEFLILLGAFNAHWVVAAIAVLGVILNATFFLSFYERAFLGPVTNENVRSLRDLLPREAVVAGALGALVLWIGFFPNPLLTLSRGSVEAVVERVEQGPAPQVVHHAD
jgi:NADH-quinone oxidoreductase subunit M